MSAVMDLFADDLEQTVEQLHVTAEPAVRAQSAIEIVLLPGKACLCSYSGGKDSTAVVNLTLNAAVRVKQLTVSCPTIYVLTADTGVESPVVRALAD